MPTNIRIIHAHDFIRATPDGELDREASLKMLTEIASAGEKLPDHCVLVDTRKAHSVMTQADLFFLCQELTKLPQAFKQKTAFLCPPERLDKAKFLALCAQNRGLRLAAFTSFEDAIEWLIAEWSDV